MPPFMPSTRLYVLIARRADVAVIFRRGPAKQVLLVRWDLSNDTFEAGQWFKAGFTNGTPICRRRATV